MLPYFGFNQWHVSSNFSTAANSGKLLRSICFILLCQLGFFISNRGLYTGVLCQLKTNRVSILYSLNIQLFCSAKSHFWISSCMTLLGLEKNKNNLNLEKKESERNCLFAYLITTVFSPLFTKVLKFEVVR